MPELGALAAAPGPQEPAAHDEGQQQRRAPVAARAEVTVETAFWPDIPPGIIDQGRAFLVVLAAQAACRRRYGPETCDPGQSGQGTPSDQRRQVTGKSAG